MEEEEAAKEEKEDSDDEAAVEEEEEEKKPKTKKVSLAHLHTKILFRACSRKHRTPSVHRLVRVKFPFFEVFFSPDLKAIGLTKFIC